MTTVLRRKGPPLEPTHAMIATFLPLFGSGSFLAFKRYVQPSAAGGPQGKSRDCKRLNVTKESSVP